MFKAGLMVFSAMVFAAAPSAIAQTTAEAPCAATALDLYFEHKYERNVSQVMELARIYLERALEEGVKAKPAMVLDIDETSLSNRESLEGDRYCLNQEHIYAFMREAKAIAIQPTLELFRFARDNGVDVFFVTGRGEAYREVTLLNLERAGYTGFAGLWLRPDDSKEGVNYKEKARKEIEESGYKIILSVGDQLGDLVGEHSRYTLLVPNPYYTSQ
jgi:predicted secreted acid phosphatase